MCRLFASKTKTPVSINFSFFDAPHPFKELIKTNRHGWGIGWYDKKKSIKIFKEGITKVKNIDNYHFSKVKSVESTVILSHVRDAIWGDLRTYNAQPLKYRKWMFIHNGDINRDVLEKTLKPEFRDHLHTQTDSEAYFYAILQKIKEGCQVWEAVGDVVEIIKKYRATAMNFIMTDGENVYAYRDYKTKLKKHTLFYLVRELARERPLKHASAKTTQLMHSDNLLKKRAVLICSERLTQEDWIPLKKGQLISIDKNLKVRIISLNGKA